MSDFVGTKAALMHGGKLVVFLRDDKADIPFPKMWDFPGGGREGSESPFTCIQREIQEEFGIKVQKASVTWEKVHPSMKDKTKNAHFFVITITDAEFEKIKFGSEGQRYTEVTVQDFLRRKDFVPHLKTRLQDYLEARSPITY